MTLRNVFSGFTTLPVSWAPHPLSPCKTGLALFGEIRLVNTSEAYFNYLKSFNMYQRASGNPFATPVQVYSNVENGMGIFAGGTLTYWDVGF